MAETAGRPLRLLLWYWGRRGAGGQLLLAWATALAARGDTELALSLSRQGELTGAALELRLPTTLVDTYASGAGFVAGLARVPALSRQLVAQARAVRADAVVSVMTHLWTPLVAPSLAAAGVRFVPVVHDAAPHPGDPALFWRWRLRRELAAAASAVALSAVVAGAVRAARPGLRVAVLPLGAHLPAGSLVRQAPAPAAPPEFLLFGRLKPYKGLDLLRDAFVRLRRTRPEVRLRVVGEGDPERLAPGLAGLPGVTIERRWVAEADIPGVLETAWAVVLPYREASQSGIIPLAAALGVPAVVTPVGGLVEQVADGVDGLVAAAATPAALAAALDRASDAGLRARLAAGAAAKGLAMRDWDAQADALRRVLIEDAAFAAAAPPP